VTYYRDSEDTRAAGVTYHLVPASIWEQAQHDDLYTPEAYEADGFIHCTNGIDQLVTVANWFYTSDTRDYRVLVLDLSKVQSDVRYDDDAKIFPHIYGPLNPNAVVDVFNVSREADGTFLSVDR
jgi:uncharacterized protein (DUF952 family)